MGVVPWDEERERTTVVVKCSYVFDPDQRDQVLSLSPVQPGFSEAGAATHPGADDIERSGPTDLVHDKLEADVLITGHAYGGHADKVLRAAVRFGDIHRRFTTVGPAPIEKMPLGAGYLRDTDGTTPIPPVGAIAPRTVRPADPEEELTPEMRRERALEAMSMLETMYMLRYQRRLRESIEMRVAREEAEREGAEAPDEASEDDALSDEEEAPDGFDDDDDDDDDVGDAGVRTWDDTARVLPLREEGTQFSAAHMSTAFPAPDARMMLEGLCRGGGELTLRLPNHAVVAVVEGAEGYLYDVDMTIDTVLIDTDAHRVSVVWRGQAPEDVFDLPECWIVTALVPANEIPPLHDIYRHLPRGWFSRAAVPSDADDILEPDVPDVGLEAARLQTMHMTPDPLLDLDGYAQVAAEVAELPDQRLAILAGHGYDQESWSLEERAWLDVVGKALSRGDLDEVASFHSRMSAARERVRKQEAS